MKFKGLIGKLTGIAPSIAAGLGGPLAGVAAKAVSEALGVANEPKALENAIDSATPQQMAALRETDADFQIRMKELDVDLFELQTKDSQDARNHFSTDWTARAIALMSISMFGVYVFMVTIQPIDQNNDAIINLVLGYLGGVVSSVVSFYFGGSSSK